MWIIGILEGEKDINRGKRIDKEWKEIFLV